MTDHIVDTKKKVTAVEWLFIELYLRFEMKGDGREMDKVLEQAKAMEKKQMIKFTEDWYNEYMDRTPERLYNETYSK